MNNQLPSSTPKPLTHRKPWKWVAGFCLLIAVSRCCEEQQHGKSYAEKVWDSTVDTMVNGTWGGR